MSDHKISTITLNVGVDVDAFHEEMIQLNADGAEHIPARSVEVYDFMPISLRNIQYMLTQEECTTLKNDPRVLDIMWGTLEDNGIYAKPTAYYEDGSVRLSNKTVSAVGATSEVNWALNACSNRTDPYASDTSQPFLLKQSATGLGVDLVIQDTGVDEAHPEFIGVEAPTTRIARVNWNQYLPTPGTLPSTYYTTLVDGHGTHVAGIAAGLTCGWARDARVISQRIRLNNDTAGLEILTAFQLLRAWHNAKSVKRPTIVNMSWNYFTDYPITPDPALGQVDTYHGVRVPAVEAEIADCVSAGIIFVSSVGDNKHHVDVVGGARYNNSYTYSEQTVYFLRGSTPSATPNVICVGSTDASTGERKAVTSACGPRVDIYAPGNGIVAAWATGRTVPAGAYMFAYQNDPVYKLARIGGTSQASAQVAGVLATWLEYNPKASYLEATEWILGISTKNRITVEAPNTFTNDRSLQGSANRFLYNGNYAFLVLKNWPANGVSVKNVPTFQP